MRAIACLFVLLLFGGCATQPQKQYQWVHSGGAAREQLQADHGQCEAQALSATKEIQRGVAIFGACMRGKGWNLIER